MKIISIILCVFLFPAQVTYKEAFRSDYAKALHYIKQNKKLIDQSCELYQNNSVLVVSLVFPELIRYSFFKDFFETAMLELLYTEYGSAYADFSIGRFQMKPSFAEKAESYISTDSVLARKYKCILSYFHTKPSEIRFERITRLKTVKWQLIYANCFLNIVDSKFRNEVFMDDEQRILFIATAYNHGFDNTAENIIKWENVKSFPYGMKNGNNPFSYAQIASDFYFNVSCELFKPADQKVLTNK